MECPRREEIAGYAYAKGLEPPDEWREDGTCSWCGSKNPEFVFQAIENGLEIVPTDKNYKIYILTNPGTPKFYFQHFSKEDRKRFTDLLNDKKIKFAQPGYFYRLPFFLVEAESKT